MGHPTLRHEIFVRRFCDRTGVDDDKQARAAIEATLGVLGPRLVEFHRAAIARRLPTDWAKVFGGPGDQQEFAVDEFYRRCAEREGVALGEGMERAQVVCEILAELLDQEGLTHLRLNLPSAMIELFQPRPDRPPVRSRDRELQVESPRQTLASGRPGSTHPVSRAAARPGQRHSIVANEDPHADTKLASTRGLSTQREHRDLASARPGQYDDD